MPRWVLRTGTAASGFRYLREDGRALSREMRERIRRLRVPPAWRDVHIAVSGRAPIQAWGRDSRGRKQYRYHESAVHRRELRKHYRVRQLATDLPRLRRRIRRDSRRRGFSRDQVAAGVVRLIEEGFFRVGSERYARDNGTFGLTTLRKSHVDIWPEHVVFDYPGKLRRRQRHFVTGREPARFVSEMLTTPGPRLFRYKGGREWRDLTADDVNAYLQEIAGFPYTAKDLRTWGGTLRAATVLAELGAPGSEGEAKKNAATAVRLVAAELGNTPAICRSSYIHPEVLNRYVKARETILPDRGRRLANRGRAGGGKERRADGVGASLAHTREEMALIRFLDTHFPERRRRRRIERPAPFGRRRGSGFAVVLAFLLLFRLPFGADGWFGPDKIKHFFVTALIQSVTYSTAQAAGADRRDAMRISIGAAAAAGLGREIYDARTKGRFSIPDLVWNAGGSAAASTMLRHTKR